jgi:hypothetical protein
LKFSLGALLAAAAHSRESDAQQVDVVEVDELASAMAVELKGEWQNRPCGSSCHH